MQQNQEISALIRTCVGYLERNGYTNERIERYKSMWRNGICLYMNDRGLSDYDPTVGERFIQTTISRIVTAGERDIIRSVSVLNDILANNNISKRITHPIKRELRGQIGEVIKRFLAKLKELRRCKSTLQGHLVYLYRFNQYLEVNAITSLEDINEQHILSFVSTQTNNRTNIISSLKLFLRFLHEERIITKDLSYALAGYKWKKTEKLPSFYSEKEVKQIEGSISQSSPVGKRNFAVLLLSTRLGLRASDIAGLCFSNIDWENSLIALEQYKTKNEIKLPLLTEVGEAIIAYLKFGRPKSETTNIFLSARAPYRPMTGHAVSSCVRQQIDASHVCVAERKKGPHAMRHSLASRLLEQNVSLPIISEALGHQTTDATMSYLQIDMQMLRKCSLDVPAVSEDFYNQKNGAFYE